MLRESNSSGVIISLGAKAHQLAEAFSQQQAQSHKTKQVYLNTLAVYAVNIYLEGMGITTDLKSSYSWNAVMQTMANVADLVIPERGRLECRYLLPDQESCYVPSEVWLERTGYVVVKLDQDLSEARLLGFTIKVEEEYLALTNLLPLEDLLDRLIGKQEKLQSSPIQLSNWLDNLFTKGWQSLQEYLQSQNYEPGFNFRSPALITSKPKTGKTNLAEGIKLIKFEKAEQQVALVVGADLKTQLESTISVKVFPLGSSTYLPQDLQLLILSETGEPVVQTKAKATKQIEVEFSGEKGEQFRVKVVLDDFSITETFSI